MFFKHFNSNCALTEGKKCPWGACFYENLYPTPQTG